MSITLKCHKFDIGDSDDGLHTILFQKTTSRMSKGTRIREHEYVVKCNKCSFIFTKKESDVEKRGFGCPCCNGKEVVYGINDITTTAPWMVGYFQGGAAEAMNYTRSSNYKIRPICPHCGRIKDKSIKINNIYHKKSIGCVCDDGISYPEKFIYYLLTTRENEIKRQFSPNCIGQKRIDFAISNKNIAIEVDGNFGHGRATSFNSDVEKQIEIDNWKTEKLMSIGYTVIRVDARQSDFNYIKNSVKNSELQIIYNFDESDFIFAEQMSLKNLVKEVSIFFKKKKDENDYHTPQMIADVFNISLHTATDYLKKGSNIGWCDYDPKSVPKKYGGTKGYNFPERINEKYIGRECVAIDKKDISKIYYYSDIREAYYSSNKKHRCLNVFDACNKKVKTYHGFIWMWKEEYDVLFSA